MQKLLRRQWSHSMSSGQCKQADFFLYFKTLVLWICILELCSNHHRSLSFKLDTQPHSHLLVEFCIQWAHMYCITPPPSPTLICCRKWPVGRWCHWSVCLVLTIEVYEITNQIAIKGTYFYCSTINLYGKKVLTELVRPYLDAYAKKSHVKGKLIIPFYSWSRHG